MKNNVLAEKSLKWALTSTKTKVNLCWVGSLYWLKLLNANINCISPEYIVIKYKHHKSNQERHTGVHDSEFYFNGNFSSDN
jgi:hypothetical protein